MDRWYDWIVILQILHYTVQGMFKGDLAITSAPQSLFTVNSKKFDLILASNEMIDLEISKQDFNGGYKYVFAL